ncbi:thrombopoietin receptor isoform X2 [Esox lucius]|uniref:thrombopoietin receptor isoform X2 n=1 Tax=Esox lucius TaxID=8010 RepID=UPI0005771EEA|nr:thrombopoietin receptor isoform X2 [Esox lucius]
MDFNLTWRTLCVGLWTIAGWLDVLAQRSTFSVGNVHYLSKEDVSLLADDEDPKCFTKTQYDFTCFWETTGKTSFDFFYRNNDQKKEKRCNVTVQRTGEEEEGEEVEEEEKKTVLHICFFPPSDVILYILTHIRVVERSSNHTLHSRNVSIEDQGLLDPPVNVSLHQTGQAGQIQVVWHQPKEWEDNVQYGIQYSSQSLGEITELIESGRSSVHSLVSLKPGEAVSVRLRVKPIDYRDTEPRGHWSAWSAPVTETVPGSAGDISLLCHTPDLQNITCQWHDKASRSDSYNLFYKIGHSEPEGWRECLPVENHSHCTFRGAESGDIRVKLNAGPASLRQTFYTEPLRISNIIQTGPPGRLRGLWEGGRLALTWNTPLLALNVHLMYQLCYQPLGETIRKLIVLQGSETTTCLDLQTGGQYLIQVRAKPNGSVYAGYWSDWSPALQVETPSNIGSLLIVCIPLVMLIMSLAFIAMFSRSLSIKVKRYLWPPVPNLDKVLNGFLTDINRQTLDPPLNNKQCSEETTPCIVEIMSEKEAPSGGKLPRESAFLLSPERGTSSWEESLPTQVLEVNPDYVTLTTDDIMPCPRGNNFPSCTTEILNHSYLLLAEQPTDRLEGPGRAYANLENTRTANTNA